MGSLASPDPRPLHDLRLRPDGRPPEENLRERFRLVGGQHHLHRSHRARLHPQEIEERAVHGAPGLRLPGPFLFNYIF